MGRSETDRLLEEHIPALRRYAFALTRDPDLADDLVQDCLERAIFGRQFRQPHSDVRVRIFTLLRSIYLHDLEKRQRAARLGTRVNSPVHSFPGEPVALEVRDVLTALDRLPEDQKTLVLLIGVEEFSYEDAARLLCVPIGTVMSRLSRARQKLREILADQPSADMRSVK